MDSTSPKVFISYSHKDEAWKDRLVQQLRVLELEGDLEVWDDRRIDAGDDWQPEIEIAMAKARVAVLLISADFLTSRFIRGTEVPELLRRRESDGLRVIPVIVRPCPWRAVAWLAKIQCRPKDGKALASFTKPKADQHLTDLALEILGLLSDPPRVETRGYQWPSLQDGGVAHRIESDAAGSCVETESSVPQGRPFPSPGFQPGVGPPGPQPSGPPLHNLPYPPLGDLFTGRQADLDALAAGGTAAITQSAAISGLGGIGKTRLAGEHAWRSGPRYTAAWFVRADSPESLRRNLAALAGPELMNLPEWETDIEVKTVAAVKRWLREHPGWLMILDNVDTPEAADAVLKVLPSLLEGRVLITSRLTAWPASVRKRPLDTLTRDEAVHFLLQRTEEGRTRAADDDRQAAALAEALDGLPLALEQAAAFILRRRMSFADYLRAWEQERSEVLKWHDPRVMEYPASVAVTWQQTFHRLSPTAAALLRLMAFLAPDPFPAYMFEQAPEDVEQAAQRLREEVGKEPDGLSVQAALDELADYSMITRQDEGMVSVHRMVQEVLRSQIPVAKDWIEGTLRIVNRAFPYNSDDVGTWPVCDLLRPHATKIATLADEEGITYPTGRLMNQLGGLLLGKGLYTETEPLLRRALAIGEASFGNEHPNVATALNNLAQLLQNMNRPEEAEPLMRRALAINEASFGYDHPNVALALVTLAWLLQVTNRLEEAEPLSRHALALCEASFGNEHPHVAVALNDLALLLQATNRQEEAEPLMRRALAIDEASLGNEHPNVAIRLNNLATLLGGTKRLEEAEPLMRRAVDIWERRLGPDHPTTQIGRRNLMRLLSEMNQDAGGGEGGSAPGGGAGA